jgi:hypothetical protein
MDFSTLQLLEGLVFALKSGAAADFLKSGQDEKNRWKMASDKFYDREKGAARDYVIPAIYKSLSQLLRRTEPCFL